MHHNGNKKSHFDIDQLAPTASRRRTCQPITSIKGHVFSRHPSARQTPCNAASRTVPSPLAVLARGSHKARLKDEPGTLQFEVLLPKDDDTKVRVYEM